MADFLSNIPNITAQPASTMLKVCTPPPHKTPTALLSFHITQLKVALKLHSCSFFPSDKEVLLLLFR